MADRSWDVFLQREQARQQRQREGGLATDLSVRLMDPIAGAPPPPEGVGSGSPFRMDGWSLGSSMLDMDTQTVVMDQSLPSVQGTIAPAGTIPDDQVDVDALIASLVSNVPDPPTQDSPSPPPPPPPTSPRVTRRIRRPRRGVGVRSSSTTTATNTRTQ